MTSRPTLPDGKREYADAADYAKHNPLGGVAKTFDIMADRLRAGEALDSVLADFNYQRAGREPDPDVAALVTRLRAWQPVAIADGPLVWTTIWAGAMVDFKDAADALLRLQRERDEAYERAAKVCETIAKEDADYGYEASAKRMRETANRIRSLTSGREG
jgi:hypothetical protein